MAAKRIEIRERGQRHGPVVRMIDPGKLGQILKPFVFLDFLHATTEGPMGFGFHPHSGIATITYPLDVTASYVDTEGQTGILEPLGLEWMQAGGGAWHKAELQVQGKATGFQLWVALPADLEEGASFSTYISSEDVPQVGGVRVLLGRYLDVESPLRPPAPMTYLDVSLAANERWAFSVPVDHDVAWVMVHQGTVSVSGEPCSDELAVLSTAGDTIELENGSMPARLLVGTAPRHPFPLVLGPYSVHTDSLALRRSEVRIAERRKDLPAERSTG